jgi:hypothetical protein
MHKLTLMLAAAALAALLAVGAGVAATRSETYKLSAKLTARQEVPKPVGAVAAAGGTFTGTLAGRKLTWKLTFKGLTGKAVAAHIHLGKPGKAGAVLVPLCGPCRSGMARSVRVSARAHDALERGNAYVNVHTAKNAGGEIRGQVKSTES